MIKVKRRKKKVAKKPKSGASGRTNATPKAKAKTRKRDRSKKAKVTDLPIATTRVAFICPSCDKKYIDEVEDPFVVLYPFHKTARRRRIKHCGPCWKKYL